MNTSQKLLILTVALMLQSAVSWAEPHSPLLKEQGFVLVTYPTKPSISIQSTRISSDHMLALGLVGGLVGSAVGTISEKNESKRNELLENMLVPHLQDYSFGANFFAALEARLNDHGFTSRKELQRVEDFQEFQALKSSVGDGFLVLVSTRYHLTPLQESLEVAIYYSIHNAQKKKPIYMNVVRYQSRLGSQFNNAGTRAEFDAYEARIQTLFDQDMDRASNVHERNDARIRRKKRLEDLHRVAITDEPNTPNWYSHGGKLLLDELEKGINVTTAVIALDLNGGGIKPEGAKWQKVTGKDSAVDTKGMRKYRYKAFEIESLSTDEIQVINTRKAGWIAKGRGDQVIAPENRYERSSK